MNTTKHIITENSEKSSRPIRSVLRKIKLQIFNYLPSSTTIVNFILGLAHLNEYFNVPINNLPNKIIVGHLNFGVTTSRVKLPHNILCITHKPHINYTKNIFKIKTKKTLIKLEGYHHDKTNEGYLEHVVPSVTVSSNNYKLLFNKYKYNGKAQKCKEKNHENLLYMRNVDTSFEGRFMCNEERKDMYDCEWDENINTDEMFATKVNQFIENTGRDIKKKIKIKKLGLVEY